MELHINTRICNYKISTKAIANRNKKSFKYNHIWQSKSGFKGCYIGENICTTFEVIENFNNENKSGLFFCLLPEAL